MKRTLHDMRFYAFILPVPRSGSWPLKWNSKRTVRIYRDAVGYASPEDGRNTQMYGCPLLRGVYEQRDWVYEHYTNRFKTEFADRYHWFAPWQPWEIVELLERIPDGPAIAKKMEGQFTGRIVYVTDKSSKEYQSMCRLLEIAGVDVDELERKHVALTNSRTRSRIADRMNVRNERIP